jgi:hypothetical protein
MNFENTRIYKLLSSAPAVELNRFSKFIHSPYFNKNHQIMALFDIVNNAIRTGNAVLPKEKLWGEIGFELPYKDIKFRKLCNDLLERYERFLAIENMESDDLLHANLLIDAVKKTGNKNLIEKHIGKSDNIFNRTPDKSSDFFLQKYMHDKTLQNLVTNYEKKEDIKKHINNESYAELSTQLDAFYVIEKLRHAIDVITWSKQYKTEIDVDLTKTLHLIETNKLSEITAVQVYWLIYQILTQDDSKSLFFELKEIAKNDIYQFPKTEQAEIFDALFSYCIRWVNKGDIEFTKEYLDIHEWGIREELILKNGILSPTSFRNYVIAGLRIGEMERVEKYINNNLHFLEEYRRDNALNFNLARLNWWKKDYEKVLEYLNKVNYDDIWYNINSKNYLLASFYEMDEIDALYSNIDSFVAFLRREKSLDATRKRRHINFTNFLKRLINKSENKAQLSKLKEEVEAEKEIVNKSWLLEKIEEQLR